MSTEGGVLLGNFTIASTSGRGFTPEEIADMTLDRIIYVGNDSHPAIREQAQAFREKIRGVLVSALRQSVKSHNTTIANRLSAAGHPELVKLLEI